MGIFTFSETVISKIADFGLDAIKKHFKTIRDEHAVRKSLREHIERQSRCWNNCSLEEEIDFQGLLDYIDHNYMGDVEQYIWEPDTEKRHKAKAGIIDMAIAYANPSTEAGKANIRKIIEATLEIIYEYFRRQVDQELWCVATAITKDVDKTVAVATQTQTEILTEQNAEIKENADRNTKAILDAICSSNEFMPEKYAAHARDGEFDVINENLQTTLEVMSTKHPLFPDYGYRWTGSGVLSVPRNEKAIQEHPPTMVVTGKLYLGETPIADTGWSGNEDINSYADRHQKEIRITIQQAQKMLGDEYDPVQKEAEDIVGSTLVRKPRPFPDPVICSIYMDNMIYYEYIELAIQELFDDGSCIMSNRQQCGRSLNIDITFSTLTGTGKIKVGFCSNIQKNYNKERLKFSKFMKDIKQGRIFILHVLKLNEDLFRSQISDSINYNTGFSSIDEEIDFLTRVCQIEDYFGNEIHIPSAIEESDYSSVICLSNFIQGKERKSKWNSFSMTGELSKDFRQEFDELFPHGVEEHKIDILANEDFILFEKTYSIQLKRSLMSAKVADIEKTKKKLDVLDDGDIICIPFEPALNDEMVDVICAEQKKIFDDMADRLP